MADLLLPFLERTNTIRSRVRDEIASRKKALRRLDAVAAAITAIRTPYRPLVPFGGSDAYRTMLVADYTMEDGALTALTPFLSHDVITNGRWHKAFPNDRGGQSMRSTEIPIDEVIATVIGLYEDGVIGIGTAKDLHHVACVSCTKPSLLYCDHWLDYEWNRQRVTLYYLCLRCPQVTEIAYVECHESTPHPLLPPKMPPPHVRQS